METAGCPSRSFLLFHRLSGATKGPPSQKLHVPSPLWKYCCHVTSSHQQDDSRRGVCLFWTKILTDGNCLSTVPFSLGAGRTSQQKEAVSLNHHMEESHQATRNSCLGGLYKQEISSSIIWVNRHLGACLLYLFNLP